MEKHDLAKILTRGIFIASFFMLSVATVQMMRADLPIEHSLQEWETVKAVEQLNEGTNGISVETSSLPAEWEPPQKGEVIGKMIIPTLDKELPIIHGTEEKQLAQGVGHYIGSVLPGEPNHSVLAGHRDTVFRGLGQVQIGDQIQVETKAGLFTYKIEKQQIVDPDDRTIIVPADEALLTLITCYPFDFVGAAPQRYILTGKLVVD